MYLKSNNLNLCRSRLRKLIIVFAIILLGGITPIYSQSISVNFKNVTIKQAIKELQSKHQYSFSINTKDIEMDKRVSFQADNVELTEVLNQIFEGQGCSIYVKDNIISVVKKEEKQDKPVNQTQKVKLTGKVADEANEPVAGATIVVKGTTNGITTNIDGLFELTVEPSHTIVVSFIGYKTQEFVVGDKTHVDITLVTESIGLDDVVVTALGIKREEKALSYNVQKVGSGELTTVKNANFMNSLAGKVAGVQINSSAAGPGSAVKVVMRGTKSITLSNNALYVIDGVPMNNYMYGKTDVGAYSSQPGTESAADINPDDIESMSVLTGPSAAALYGYEGSNGVILITTKKGRAGKTTVSYSNSTTFSSPLMMPEFQNKYGNTNGLASSWGAPTEYRYDPANFFNTGVNLVNSASISTGNDKSQSYLSFSANNANGILPNNEYDRYNFTYRNTSSFLNDKFLMDASINYIVQESKNMVSQGQYFNPLPALYLFPRGEDFREVQLFERYDVAREVNVQFWPYGDQGLSLQNPYWIMNRMNREVNRRRYIFSTSLKYNITDWLNVAGRVNVDNSNLENTDSRYAGTLAVFAGAKGRFRVEDRDERQTYADVIASLNKKVGSFSVNVNLGASIKDRRVSSRTIEGDLEKITNWFTIENMGRSVGIFKLDDDGLKRQTQSVFANAEFGYNNFLFLTLTGRNDWDSALAWSESKERSFFYPSVGLSSLASEVIQLPDWFNYLKGRVAFTSVGNSYDPYLTRRFYIYDDQTDSYQLSRTKPNYNLKPEITNSFEAGLNMKFFDASLSLDATYYYSNTRNQTHLAKLADGRNDNVYIQAGNVLNSGIELALGYDQQWGDFSWASNWTFTYNKNKVERLVSNFQIDGQEIEISEINKATLGSSGSPQLKLTEGGTMGDIYMTSDFKRDNNGYIYLDHSTLLPSMVSLNPDDYKKLGSLLPKYNMGWRNSFSYKGLRLNVLLSGRFGGLAVSNTQAILDRYGVSEHSARLREAGGVTINGNEISAQDFLNIVGEGTGKADYYVYDATNIRLQEVSLEYMIPKKKLNNVADVTLALVGSNLAMLYCKAPFDPELVPSASSTFYTGVDYFMQPSLRNIGFSIKLQF
ncbi:SusC/RagA family TonB-linked outer membrane protein [Maribellus sp. CM-23]|nr:SusC/RagA family TonB-linked outer membrane protein [Maribellus sp. CM-23]